MNSYYLMEFAWMTNCEDWYYYLWRLIDMCVRYSQRNCTLCKCNSRSLSVPNLPEQSTTFSWALCPRYGWLRLFLWSMWYLAWEYLEEYKRFVNFLWNQWDAISNLPLAAQANRTIFPDGFGIRRDKLSGCVNVGGSPYSSFTSSLLPLLRSSSLIVDIVDACVSLAYNI